MCDTNLKCILFDDIASEETNVVFYSHRKATFKKWCFDKSNAPCSSDAVSFDKSNAPCSSDALARAGFIYSGTRIEPAAATCVFCLKEMIFEEEDDPWMEHRSHTKHCGFVELNKLDEKDWTLRDFLFLLSCRIAAKQRQSLIDAANDLRAASDEIVRMSAKAVSSVK